MKGDRSREHFNACPQPRFSRRRRSKLLGWRRRGASAPTRGYNELACAQKGCCLHAFEMLPIACLLFVCSTIGRYVTPAGLSILEQRGAIKSSSQGILGFCFVTQCWFSGVRIQRRGWQPYGFLTDALESHSRIGECRGMVAYGWRSPGLTPDGTYQSLLLLCLQSGLAAGDIPWDSLGPPKLSYFTSI